MHFPSSIDDSDPDRSLQSTRLLLTAIRIQCFEWQADYQSRCLPCLKSDSRSYYIFINQQNLNEFDQNP
jgi:hypothetical protein